MKLQKVHIALLTNVTEGKVKNEHITMYYSKEVTAKTVMKRMIELNKILPVDLFEVAYRDYPDQFRAWSGEVITCVGFNLNLKIEPYLSLLKGIEKPHITIGKDQSQEGFQRLKWAFPELNWHEGLKVGECHVGWKIDGEMQYFNEDQFRDEIMLNNGGHN